MRDKVLFYAFGILVVVILVLSVQIYFLKSKVNIVLEGQIKELSQLKEKNQVKSDSIGILRKKKVAVIAEAEQLFYGDVAKAKENNTYYEDIKKNIRNTDDADSLARQLAKRYSER